MGLMDRDYTREAPRWHMGESSGQGTMHDEWSRYGRTALVSSSPSEGRGARAAGSASSVARYVALTLIAAGVSVGLWAASGGLKLRYVPSQASAAPMAKANAQTAAAAHPLCLLHNRDWARVSLKPRRYVGCRVDVAGNMYNLQVMDGHVEYNTNLDPNGSHEWDVFAQDYADNPPSIAANTYVEITGKIDAATEAYSALSGGFIGYVPQIHVISIRSISAKRALTLGLAAT